MYVQKYLTNGPKVFTIDIEPCKPCKPRNPSQPVKVLVLVIIKCATGLILPNQVIIHNNKTVILKFLYCELIF